MHEVQEDTRLVEVQAELKTIHDDLQKHLERVAAIGREILEAEGTVEPFAPMKPSLFVAEELREIGEDTTLEQYLEQLSRLAEMTPGEIRGKSNRRQWQMLIDVSIRASRGLNEIGDLLNRACGTENAVGLASLFRGVHQASSDYVVLAERLEAHARADLNLQGAVS